MFPESSLELTLGRLQFSSCFSAVLSGRVHIGALLSPLWSTQSCGFCLLFFGIFSAAFMSNLMPSQWGTEECDGVVVWLHMLQKLQEFQDLWSWAHELIRQWLWVMGVVVGRGCGCWGF